MRLSIPRGTVYHAVSDDLRGLLNVLYEKLDQEEIIAQWEDKFAHYIGRNHSVAFPYARTAIYCSLKTQTLPAGSEIVMPPITIKAILDAVLDLGLRPIFVDINIDTLCFDIEKLEQGIGVNTRAILITYLFGIVPNMDEILSLCKKNNLFVIEDFSHCLNGRYKQKKLGCFGDVGVYSASSIKTLDTYGGGLLVCDDDDLHLKLRKLQSGLEQPSRTHLVQKIITDLIRNVATSRLVFHFLVFPIIKIMSALKMGSVIKHTGARDTKMIKALPREWFKKYTSFQAKLGLTLLDSVENSDQARINNVALLKSKIRSLSFPRGVANTHNVYWQLVTFFDHSTKIQNAMHAMGVDTATTSLDKISTLSEYPYQGDTPNADYLYGSGLFIPSFPSLSMKDLQHISDVVNTTINNKIN